MSREYVAGTEFVTKQGIERRVDVTPDWQVWADQEKRLDNLDALSAVMIAGYVANLDRVLDNRTMYKNSFEEYNRLVRSEGAERIGELEEDIDTRLGSVFSQPFRKIYLPATSILNKNILPIKVLNPRYLLLLVNDVSDSKAIVNAVRNSKIAEADSSNNAILQNRILDNLVSRRYVATDYSPQEAADMKPKTKNQASEGTISRLTEGITEVPTRATQAISSKATESKQAQTTKPVKPTYDHDNSPVPRHELQPGITDVREYAGAMVEYIKKIGNEPFDIDDLVSWAEEQGFHPNRFEIERRVLLAVTNAGLIKKTNVYVSHKQAKEKWVLLEK